MSSSALTSSTAARNQRSEWPTWFSGLRTPPLATATPQLRWLLFQLLRATLHCDAL
jgi:hypothetical protein